MNRHIKIYITLSSLNPENDLQVWHVEYFLHSYPTLKKKRGDLAEVMSMTYGVEVFIPNPNQEHTVYRKSSIDFQTNSKYFTFTLLYNKSASNS